MSRPVQTRDSAPGFTIVELLMVILIIALLMGLLLYGVRAAMRTAKINAAQVSVAGMRDAVEQFRTDHGFLPPLVQDSPAALGLAGAGALRPLAYTNGDPTSVVVYPFDVIDSNKVARDFLRGWSGSTRMGTDGIKPPDLRYSVLSLPIYLAGACDVQVGTGANATVFDGVSGPGTIKPNADGTFEHPRDPKVRAGKTFGPYYQSKGDVKLDVDPTGKNSKDFFGQQPDWWGTFKDRNGVPIRYYRWLKGDRNTTSTSVYDNTNKFQVDWLNVPELLGNPSELSQLRDAEFAIVAAGPDGAFGDWGTENKQSNFAELTAQYRLSTNQSDAAQYNTKARVDNIVEAGK